MTVAGVRVACVARGVDAAEETDAGGGADRLRVLNADGEWNERFRGTMVCVDVVDKDEEDEEDDGAGEYDLEEKDSDANKVSTC